MKLLRPLLLCTVLFGCVTKPLPQKQTPAPTSLTNLVVALTVQVSDAAGGPWVDLPISWVTPLAAPVQFYRLKIEGVTNLDLWVSPAVKIISQ